MKDQDETLLTDSPGRQSLLEPEQEVNSPRAWPEEELWRQQMLALTLWSVYWNVGLFWIPHYTW